MSTAMPSDWKVASLGDLASAIQYGYTEKAQSEKVGPRFLRITDIQDNSVDWESVPFCAIPDEKKEKYLLRQGDIVFARTGATVGKSFLISSSIPESVFASYLIRVRPGPEVDPKYVAYFFQSSDYWRQISESKAGIGQPNVNGKKLAQIRIPVAPLDEQRQIVAEIEKQFSRLDKAVTNLHRVKANLKRYKAAVLKAAVEGRLVETEAELARREGRTYETGEQLLQRVLEQRRSQWKGKGKYKAPDRPCVDTMSELPEGWVMASLEQITASDRVICYGILMPKENISNGVPYVKVKDLKGDKIAVASLQRTSKEIAAKYARSSLREGDLLLAIRGTYGRVAEVPPELEGGNITQDSARLAISPFADRDYVAWFLRSPDEQNYFKSVARGVAVKGVNIGDVRLCPIFFPPFREQQRIVAEVDRQISLIREIDEQVRASLKRAELIRQSMLMVAFNA